MKLLGAGGGGYALFISPNPREAEALREIIARRFENDRARLVDFCLDKAGLEVTVS
jgi:galactokinase/mevalonate kinase-like predicted kinase